MALATLSIDLVARLAQFEKDLGQGVRIAEKNADSMARAFGRVQTAAAALAGSALVVGVANMTRESLKAIDAYNDLADATGSSVEKISALDSLVRRTGGTFDTTSGVLIKFNAALADATATNEKGKVFQALGLDVEKLKKLDPAEALRQTAIAMQGFRRDGELGRATQMLFSKSVGEAAPLLKDLAQAGTLVATTTTEQAEAVEAFNKRMYESQAAMEDGRRQMVASLIPTLNEVIDGFKGATDGASGFAVAGAAIRTVIETVAVIGSDLVFVFKGFGREIGGIVAQLAALQRLDFNGFREIGEALRADGAQARAELDRYQYRVLNASVLTSSAGAGRGGIPNDPRLLGTVSERSLKLNLGGDKSAESLAEQGRKLALSLAGQSAQLAPDFYEKWNKLSAAYKGNKISLSELTEAQERLLRQQPFMKQELFVSDVSDALSRRLDALERSRKALEDLNAEIDRLADNGDTRKRQLTEQLEARLNAGEVFSKEELDRIVRGIAGISEATGDLNKNAINFADVFESSFERAIIKGEKLSEVFKGLAQDIAQVVLREQITKPAAKAVNDLFSGGSGGGSNAGAAVSVFSAIGSLFGFAQGGVMTPMGPLPLRKYANGGVATGPQLAMYGEGSMNEAYVPLPDGRRIPVAMRGGGGGAVTIIQNLTVGDVASQAHVQEQLKQSERRIMGGLRRRSVYGNGDI